MCVFYFCCFVELVLKGVIKQMRLHLRFQRKWNHTWLWILDFCLFLGSLPRQVICSNIIPLIGLSFIRKNTWMQRLSEQGRAREGGAMQLSLCLIRCKIHDEGLLPTKHHCPLFHILYSAVFRISLIIMCVELTATRIDFFRWKNSKCLVKITMMRTEGFMGCSSSDTCGLLLFCHSVASNSLKPNRHHCARTACQ